jgi:hypothetical protein
VAAPSAPFNPKSFGQVAPSISAEGSQLRWRTLLLPLSGSAGRAWLAPQGTSRARPALSPNISENADTRRFAVNAWASSGAFGVGSWFLPLFVLNISAC